MRTKARSTAGSRVVRLAEGGPEAQDEPGARNQGTESRLQSIAIDVGQHFLNNFKGTGLKASLWLPPSGAAIQLKKLFGQLRHGDGGGSHLCPGDAVE
jgi:hypothetical protein